jgi:hypothetical protein
MSIARIVKPTETAVIRERLYNHAFDRQWLSSRHVIAAADTHETMEDLLEETFSMRSVSTIYNKDKLPLRDSLETALRRVGCWCEIAAILRGREAGRIGKSIVGRRYQAAQ